MATLIDPETSGQQFSPDIVVGGESGDTATVVWVSYESGLERIFARTFGLDAGNPQSSVQLLDSEGHPQAPRIASVGSSTLVCWIANGEDTVSARDGGRFERQEIRAAISDGERWRRLPTGISADSITHLSLASCGMSVWIAWCELVGFDHERICVSRADDGNFGAPTIVEESAGINRPEIAAHRDGCIITYDRYQQGVFTIEAAAIDHGCSILDRGPVAADPQLRQLAPTVAVDSNGRQYVCWLVLSDVVDADGIVDQYPTVRGAARSRSDDSEWQPISAGADGLELATLAWGLLSHEGAGVWGYLGNRRLPMLKTRAGSSGAWLLWERKIDHDGPTAITGGQLCSRRISVEGMTATADTPLIIASGPRGYRIGGVAGSTRSDEAPWVFAGRAAPSVSTERLMIGLTEPGERLVEPGRWNNWSHIRVSSLVSSETRASTKLYWADLHVHSGLSADAEGYIDELAMYARDSAGLDVLVLQDNDHYNLTLTSSEFDYFERCVERYTEPGRFIVIPGFEWTYFEPPNRRPNHRTVFGTSSRFGLLRNTEAGDDPLASLEAFAATEDAVVHIHHERFALLKEGVDRNMEICSGWGLHMGDPAHRDWYHRLLGAGHRLGFIGGSDNHRRNPGMGGALTGIYAEALNRKSIVEALKSHRCFATAGARIVVQLEAAGGSMGESVSCTDAPLIRATVTNADQECQVNLYRDGKIIYAMHGSTRDGGRTLEFELTDDDAGRGTHFYYLEVNATETVPTHPSNLAPAITPMAWSSPVWVTVA